MSSTVLAFIAGLLGFWTIVYLLGRGKKGKIEVYPGALLIRAGISLDPMPEGKKRKLLIVYGWISVVLLAVSAGLFYYYVGNLIVLKYIKQPEQPVAGFSPLIPGVTLGLVDTLYVFFAVGVAAFFHETAHAFVARAVRVKVKDAGIALFLFIPAAFVEPDEEELKRAPVKNKLLVYSAGVGANIILTFIVLGLLSQAAVAWESGVLITNVVENSPAWDAGLRPGMTIIGVNGIPVNNTQELAELFKEIDLHNANKTVSVTLTVKLPDGNIENITVVKPAGETLIGIYIKQSYDHAVVVSLLRALYIINFSLALVNAAPLAIPLPGGMLYTDGAQILRDLLAPKVGEEKAAILTVLVGVLTLAAVISLMSLTKLTFS